MRTTSLRCALAGALLALAAGAVGPARAGTGGGHDVLLTTVTSANYVSLADARTLDELAQVGGGSTAPSVPEVLPGGKTVYVQFAGQEHGSIALFDVAQRRFTHRIEPGGTIGDRSARIQRDGRYYYYGSIPDGDVTQVDTRTNRVSRVFAGLGNNFTVSPDGRTLFTFGEGSTPGITSFDARTGRALGRVTLPDGGVPLVTGGVGWMMISPDGTQVVKMDKSAVVIDVRDPRHMSVTASVPLGSNPALGDISPDSRQLWVPNSGDGTITVVDLRTHRVLRTLQTGRYLTALTFDQSGRHVFVAEDRPGGVGPGPADLVALYVGQVAAGQFAAGQQGQYTSRPVLDTPGRVVKYDVATGRPASVRPLLTVTVPVQLVAFHTPS